MTAFFDAPHALAQAAIDAGAPIVIEAEGVLWDGRAALPGAAALLAQLGTRAAIVSNDARHTTEQYAARLAAAGLRVPAERLVTAGSAAVAMAAIRFAGRPVMLLAPRGLVAAATALGLEPSAGSPAALLVCDDTDLTWTRLAAATAALAAGVPGLAASADPLAADGSPGPGTLLAALHAAVPRAVIECVGLPGPGLLRHAAARAGAGAGRPVLIAPVTRAEAAQQAEMILLPAEPAQVAAMAPGAA